jgi:MFS family permease
MRTLLPLECCRGVTIGVREKYVALLIFCLFTMNCGFAWLMFDPVDEELRRTFNGIDDSQLELLSSWQPLVSLIAFFPILGLVTTSDGLRRAVRLGATSELIGATIKLSGVLLHRTSAGLYLLHLGQIFSAVASPVASGAVSGLSAEWFDPEERTRSTAAAVLSNNVGNAVCYLIVPAITASIGFSAVTGYELALASVECFLAWTVFPAGRASSIVTSATEKRPICPQIKQVLSEPSAVLLLVIYSWSSGGYVAWTSLFDSMFRDFYSSEFIGQIGFCGIVAFVLGGLASSYLTDLYFYRQMKQVIFCCMTMNCLSCLLFISCTPDESGYIVIPLGDSWIMLMAALCGFFNGAAAPIFYELIAEITYPVQEMVSGNLMSMCENVGALVLYQFVARVCPVHSMSFAFAGGMTAMIVLSSMVRQRYGRSHSGGSTTEASPIVMEDVQ